jgi:hemerythrin-like domain-containing protein
MSTMIMLTHHAFRRDLARFKSALKSFDPAREDLLREEWKHYHDALHGHHVQEDAHIFPNTKKEHPEIEAAIDHLSDQHHRIEPLLERCNQAFARLQDVGEAAAVIEELDQLLDAHLDMEEAVLIPTLRGAKQFPPPPDAATAAMYADGFAWSVQGIAPSVLEKVREMLPPILLEKLPAAIETFRARCERVWGRVEQTESTTSIPGV